MKKESMKDLIEYLNRMIEENLETFNYYMESGNTKEAWKAYHKYEAYKDVYDNL